MRSLRIGRVAEVGAAYAFHQATLGDFLLPLPPDGFAEMVAAGQVLVVHRGSDVVGMSYVKPDGKGLDEVPRWEIGGVHLDPAVRGHGLAEVLTLVRIAEAIRIAPKPVMAYVHRDNRDPRNYLRRLGFAPTGRTVRLGPDEARGYLRRDSAGAAVADVLALKPSSMDRVAEWVERFDGTASGRQGSTVVTLADDLLQPDRATVAAALRGAARASASLPRDPGQTPVL